MDSRYRIDDSLIGLNIVEQIEGVRQNIKLYRITDFGKEILRNISEH